MIRYLLIKQIVQVFSTHTELIDLFEKRLDNETMKTKFTLQNGDFIVKGEVHDIVDEYTKSQRATDIKDKYKELGVMTINTISDNSDDARGIPHYMVGEING